MNRPKDQVAKSYLWLPYWITNKMLTAVQSAESKLGRPPTIIETLSEVRELYPTIQIEHIYHAVPVVACIIREDWIYCDEVGYHISLTKHEGFMSFSERFRKHFGNNYICDKNGRIDTAPSVKGETRNIEQILTMLKSKDASLYEAQKESLFDGTFRFLDKTPLKSQVAFLSFPRSGNSLMRRVLEQSFGVATGSTGSLGSGTYLQINGLKGQNIADDRCWIVKSHHPSVQPGTLTFKSEKVLCIVRNPLDVIVSFATLCNTMSHSAELEFEFHTAYPEWWNWWVHYMTDQIDQYFSILYKDCIEDGINPIHTIRFEDLLDDTTAELTSMMKFCLEMEDLTGTNMERRIQAIKEMGSKATNTYKLKEHSKNKEFNKKRHMFNDEQFEYVKTKLARWNWYYGFVKHEGNERTGYFEYENPTAEQLASYKGFRAHNEQAIKDVAAGEKYKGKLYHVNGTERQTFESFTKDNVLTVQYPARDFTKRKLGYGEYVDERLIHIKKANL